MVVSGDSGCREMDVVTVVVLYIVTIDQNHGYLLELRK